MEQNEEKIVGTNLTVVPEFSQTALGLAELKKEFAGVVYNVENNPAELKLAKQAKKKLTTLRTTLDKTKKDVKADLLERTRKIDGEYNRILGEIRSLEDPIGDQIDREENRIALEQAEALRVEQERIDGHKARIQGYRDLPGTMIGMPSARIARELAKFPALNEADLPDAEEFAQESDDAYEACRAKLQRLFDDAKRQEDEVEAQRQRDEEASALRARNAQLEREAEERRLADERREREQREAAERKEREEREAAERAERQEREAAEQAERARLQAIRDEEQRVENERLERERNEAHARAVEAERIQREQAAKAEEERQASLTLRTSAMALLHRVQTEGMGHWQEAIDLGQVLATSEGDVKPTKRQAAKPAKVAR